MAHPRVSHVRALAAGTAAALLPLTAAGSALAATPTPTTAAGCTGAGYVWVHVQRDNGVSQGGCATSFATGAQALTSAGFTIDSPSFIRQINGYPGTPNNSGYWSYYHREKASATAWGPWNYSQEGAGTYAPKPGSVEGWRYVSLADSNLTPDFDPGAVVPVTPTRVLDTRTGNGAPKALVPGYGTLGVQVLGRNGLPATGVSAVVLNVTTTDSTALGWVTAWPTGAAKPPTSNLNHAARQTIANQVMLKVGPDGKVNLSPSATSNLIVDVAGYVPAPGNYVALAPSRIHDTRATGIRVPAHGYVDVPVLGRAGVPTTGVESVTLNVTATAPGAAGYLTAYPSGSTRPNASNVNYPAKGMVAGLVEAKVDATGTVRIYSDAETDVVVDVNGYFPASSEYRGMVPSRVLDTRYAVGVPATGPVAPGGTIALKVAGVNGVPTTAKAVMLNVTSTAATGAGAVTVWPGGGQPKPLASVLNLVPGGMVANSVLVAVGSDGTVRLSSSGGTQLIADVQGYTTR